MKRLALAGMALTAASAATAPVLAADLPQSPAPAYEAVPAPQQSIDWSGIYVGGNLGWNFGNFDNQSGSTSLSTSANGVGGGLYTGYNFQVTPNVIVGAEADFSLTDLKDSRTNGGLNLESKSNWNSNIRARVGYSFDRYLVYGAGGLALADLELSGNGDSDRKTALGWTVGAGGEAAITNNVSARLEYVYQDFGSQDFNLNGTGVSSEFNNSQVRMGIGYKF
ncbi:outer membrane protein [Roseibium sediminicola]|uniref:Porin family protein n=1 Tax=Roseibium sediminicola TaxID=2933272 RepID=A0ABT0GT42_9HYPH|nr:outer membrane protein [Roseibium sp. CAU 1639]MCK7612599.1 porin family protein [Roseibium sp. CAU 1639]